MAKGDGNNNQISIRVVPDLKKFESELRAQLESIEKRLKVKIPVELESAGLEKTLAGIQSRVQEFPILTDLKSELGDADAITARFQKRLKEMNIDTRGMTNNVSLYERHMTLIRTHWAKVGQSISEAAKGIDTVRKESDSSNKSVRDMSQSFRNLAFEAKRGSNLIGRTLRLFARDVTGTSGVLKGFTSGLTGAVEGISNLSRGAFIFVGILAFAAPLLGLIATLLATLPALAAAFVGPLAAIALGFDGIKQAAKQLEAPFNKLKKSLSAEFAKGLTPVFKQLAKVFPVLEKGLKGVVGGVVSLTKAFTDSVTSAKGMSQIQNLLTNVGKLLDMITPGIRSMMDAFLTLGSVASDSFSQLAGFLNNFFRDFNNVVQEVSSNGLLADAIKGMTKVFEALGRVFNQVFKAGLQAMSALGGPMADLFSAIGDVLVALMPILTTFAKVFSQAFVALAKAIVPVLNTLAGPFERLATLLGDTFAQILEALTPLFVVLAANIGILVDVLVRALAPILPVLIKFLGDLANILATHMSEAFNLLLPLVVQLVQFIVDLFTALEPLLPEILKLATAIAGAFMDALIQLMPALMDLAKELFPLLIQAAKDLLPVIIDELIPALIDMLPHFVELARIVAEHVIPAIKEMVKFISENWPTISTIITTGLRLCILALRLFQAIFSGDWSSFWRRIADIARELMPSIGQAVQLGLQTVITIFTGLPGKVLRAIGNLGKLLFNKGRELIQGFIDGIQSMARAASNAFSAIRGAIGFLMDPMTAGMDPTITPGIAVGPAMQGLTSLQGAMQGLTSGVGLGIPNVMADAADGFSVSGMQGNISAHIEGSDFGNLSAVIETALTGWSVQVDGDGIARMVNKANNRRARR